jgi:predicted P-loop ATPase
MIRCFFVGAVARVMKPGYKHDTVLTLKSSEQGLGKTSFFRRLISLIPNAFLEGQEDVQSKDALLAMHRAFIVEIGEIDRIVRSKDAEILKNFLSRQTDVVRSPYSRRHQDRDRSFVVVGTTNQSGFLVDSTGHRRFHVIETGSKPFNLALLDEVRDQLWAQAVADYAAGEPSWLSAEMNDLHLSEMKYFETEDPWEEQVATAIAGLASKESFRSQKGVTISQILDEIGIKPECQNHQNSTRVCGILKKSGWCKEKNQKRIGTNRLRLWVPPADDSSWH